METSQVAATTEQVWRELSDRLRQFVLSRRVAAADADDVLQNVFLRIHQNLSSLDRLERLESWVFQITRNAVIDHFRKSRGDEPDVDALAVIDLPPQVNFNSAVAGCLRSLVLCLPVEQREAILLYEFEGLSQQEIALRHSISLSGAKSRVQRGRQGLENLLRECCEFQLDRRGNVIDWEQNAASACGGESCGCQNCE
jgi:RNA polymerase sigma-70 factor (ECF subfamily)